jgi:hypothetical protein
MPVRSYTNGLAGRDERNPFAPVFRAALSRQQHYVNYTPRPLKRKQKVFLIFFVAGRAYVPADSSEIQALHFG